MAIFRPFGPYSVDVEKRNGGGRTVFIENFWEENSISDSIRFDRGIYVFSIKPPRTKTYKPYYVGQAKHSFSQEIFAASKLLKYNDALANYGKGAPYLFFLVHPQGKLNVIQIGELENYLIMMGFAVNPKIQNDRNAKLPAWAIQGVIRGTARKPSKSAKAISSMFNIKSRIGV